MMYFRINSNLPGDPCLNIACKFLRNDGVICYPTETVYGLGANIFSEIGFDRIAKAKERKEGESFLILVLENWVYDNIAESERIRPLMEKFWPGKLTIIGTPSENSEIPKRLLSPDGGLAVRSASTPFTVNLIQSCGFPILSTSANKRGETPPNRIDPKSEWLQKNCDLLLDAGRLDGKPSTVADVRQFPQRIIILREGILPIDEIHREFPQTEILR